MKKLTAVVILLGATVLSGRPASAMELDWSGQFRSEFTWLKDYIMDSSNPPLDSNRAGAGGYYTPPGGSANAEFQTLFLKLKPKLVVNDNIYIKSEFWLGDPVYGFFGSASPNTPDEKYFYSSFSRGSAITAQRFWGEFLTDFGTLQIGRVPLNYGLGIVWNSGDGMWDHYESTGDAIRLISKFGAFTFSPAFISYSTGNTIGGAGSFNPTTGTYSSGSGGGGMTDYSLVFKYENPDEDFEGGLNFIRRIGGGAQDSTSGYRGIINTGQLEVVGFDYNTWDIFAKKRLGKLTLAGEAPIVSGEVGGLSYQTFALALEGDYKFSDTWEVNLKAGHAPGQPNLAQGQTLSTFNAFYFNPDYHIGMIMFNYQLANIGQLNVANSPGVNATNLHSPYDNPIEDANYAAITGMLHTDKWTFDAGLVYAAAPDTAATGYQFYNNRTRSYPGQAIDNQGSSLGWETDLGAAFQYDENFQFRLDLGLYLPGNFFAFSNAPQGGVAGNAPIENATSAVFGAVARVGVSF